MNKSKARRKVFTVLTFIIAFCLCINSLACALSASIKPNYLSE